MSCLASPDRLIIVPNRIKRKSQYGKISHNAEGIGYAADYTDIVDKAQTDAAEGKSKSYWNP